MEVPKDLFVRLTTPTGIAAVVGVAVLGLTGFVTLLALYNYFFHPIAHVKGPFIASITPIWLIRAVAGHHLNNEIEALHRKYGPVVRVAPNELSLASEEALKVVMNPSHAGAEFTKKGTSEELILSLVFSAPNLLTVQDPASHKRLRVALQPAFTAKALLEQQDITQFHVQQIVDGLAAAANKPNETINLSYELSKLIWGIVGDLCFGEPMPLKQLDHHEEMKALHVKVAPLLEFFQYLTALPMIGGLARLLVHTARVISGPAKNVLGKKELRGQISRQEGRKDFLTAILGAKESAGLSPAEIHSNMSLLLMGGYDSTQVTLSALFYYLLNGPHYKNLQMELRRAYASVDDIDCNNVLRQPLLNACVNEVLRLVPPINGHGSHRVATKGVAIEGVWIPAGTLVSADIYTIQRDPNCWASPNEYLPERWLDAYNGPGTPFEKDVRTAWRPFSLGPRVCIGREMALQSLRLAVAKIVYSFDMELVNREFVWDRDAGSHFVWHNYDIFVKAAIAQASG